MCERSPQHGSTLCSGPEQDELRVASAPHRGESEGQLVGVFTVIEWSQGHDGRQTREPNQQAGGYWMSRRQRHRRNHLSSWFSMMAAISIEGHPNSPIT
jgi:hypothetical protein